MNYETEYSNYMNEYKQIPYHIKNKLLHMPNNKGFICNGIWLFGHQKSTSNKINIMFEKHDMYIYIHEITYKYHKITEMNLLTKEKKLIRTMYRKKFNNKYVCS